MTRTQQAKANAAKENNMATTTYAVTAPDGSTITRKSQSRIYSHAVIYRRAPECLTIWPEAHAAADAACPSPQYDDPNPGRDEAYDKRSKASSASIKAHQCSDTCDIQPAKWVAAGWCGRLDLGQKLHAKQGAGSILMEATVAHVTGAAKTPEEAAKRKASAAKGEITRRTNLHTKEQARRRAKLHLNDGQPMTPALRRDVVEQAAHDLTCGYVNQDSNRRSFNQVACPAGVVPQGRRLAARAIVMADLGRRAAHCDKQAEANEYGDGARQTDHAKSYRAQARALDQGEWLDVRYSYNAQDGSKQVSARHALALALVPME